MTMAKKTTKSDQSYAQNEAEKKECEEVIKRQEKFEAERSTTESTWQEILQYVVPRKGNVISEGTPGEKRGSELFDTTAIMANELLAGALHSMLTNMTSPFFELVFGDEELDNDEEVRAWLQKVADAMHHVMNNSNFQTEVHELYIDLPSIGMATMYAADHKDAIVHFSARDMKEIYVDENNLGMVDIVHRVFRWKARQIIQEFGEDKVPDVVKKKFGENSEDQFKIIHAVEPETRKDQRYKFRSRYILAEEKCKLDEGGYAEFPFVTPRWTKTSGEKYGRGCGTAMLPDVKMVNVMMETTLKGAQKTVDPPLMVPDDGVIGRVRLTPGGLTVVRPGFEIKPLTTDARIDFGYQAVEDVRKRIRSGWYVDQLQLNEGPQMTATEVNQRTEEKLRLMGPVLGRQHFEFLRPLIERVYGIMLRAGKIPPVPAKAAKRKFDVRYSSLIAKAQRMSQGANLGRALAAVAPIVNAMPAALDNLDGDKAFRWVMGDVYGIPQYLFKKDREIKDVRDQRSQAQQQAAQEAQQQHAAEIANKVAPLVQKGAPQ
jgi:hypothetical protein